MIHGDYTERKSMRYPDRVRTIWNSDVYDADGTPVGYRLGITLALLTLPLLIPSLLWYGHFNADGQLRQFDPTTYEFVTPNHFDLQVPQRKILFQN